MINQGKCPKCGKPALHVNVNDVMGMVAGESRLRCLSYSCIHCDAVLGVQIDPRAKARAKKAVVGKAVGGER